MSDSSGSHQEPERELRATPELEDFKGKYESGKVGQALLDRYFQGVAELVDKVQSADELRAIEIGCGEGLSTMRLQSILDESVDLSASEYVPDQVVAAQRNNPAIDVIQESIYELTHEPGSFNIVFLLEVLEHLDYPDLALQEVARILEPGGYLIAGVPREPLWRLLNMARGKYLKSFGNTPGHLNHWSRRGFIRYVDVAFGEVLDSRSPIPWTLVIAKKSAIGDKYGL